MGKWRQEWEAEKGRLKQELDFKLERERVRMLEDVKKKWDQNRITLDTCLLYTSPSPRDATLSRMPSSA